MIPESSEDFMFTVYGTPIPQGSTRAFIPKGWNRPVITAANAKTKPWRQEIANVALGVIGSRPILDNAVMIEAHFYFEKPKSTGKKVVHKITKPDLDKLIRSLLDALTGIVFKDDAQVTVCELFKQFGSPARCEVRIRELKGTP